MLELHEVTQIFFRHTANEKVALDKLSLTLTEGDFVTVIGSNGAGKSTLLNVVAGEQRPVSGTVSIDDRNVTRLPVHKVARYVGRVFQDPTAGTMPHGTIEQNLAMAWARGRRRGLRRAVTRAKREIFRAELARLELGLEDRMRTDAGLLSGGQRQALSLLMAAFTGPRLLLLDEHTAALDPARAALVIRLTRELVERHGLTTLMVTHNMQQALSMGNRLIMMHEGRIIHELAGAAKQQATVEDLLRQFEKIKAVSDRTLLS
ncbi:MAG: ATP-binding cassette domain-containing protein [Propionicimonas sp.]|uniref:ABC transporter ATP-binding protein n=1 Tax=Propionicimonas sp. TaxID=1955623 RepID=UPI002B1FD90A|nr:ATP-binding cassette domain-containing protein [Propionicimonas sp.]MEA4943215.1 ATP-binding cassette domain-containing protein [Propionicimonas sp.]